MDQRRRDRRIDAARQPQEHFFVADLRADRCRRLRRRSSRMLQSPSQPQMSRTKRASMRRALLRVRDLGMELHAVEPSRLVGHRGDGARSRCCAISLKPGGNA